MLGHFIQGGGNVLSEAEGAPGQDMLVRPREGGCELAECRLKVGDALDDGTAAETTGARGDMRRLVFKLPVRSSNEPGAFGILVEGRKADALATGIGPPRCRHDVGSAESCGPAVPQECDGCFDKGL
jgi:hypothetical protein